MFGDDKSPLHREITFRITPNTYSFEGITNIKAEHTVQLTSYGGAGTSAIYGFLKKLNLNIPSETDCGIWKHIRVPPSNVKQGFKAVYIFSNPLNSILSIFRRHYQIFHLERMGIKPLELEKKVLTIDEYIKKYPNLEIFSSLKKYISADHDYYKLDEHFINWTTAKRNYPIMIVKYETLWNHLDKIFKFLEIADYEIDNFPKYSERNSIWQKQPKEIRQKLFKIYGNIYKKTMNYDEIKII